MIKPLSEVAKEAIELPQNERLRLARILLDLSDAPSDPAPEVEEAWEEEISRRIHSIDSGKAKGIPFEDVLHKIDTQFGK